MKITDVKPLLAAGASRVYVFVKVETDQPGLVGWAKPPLKASRVPWRVASGTSHP